MQTSIYSTKKMELLSIHTNTVPCLVLIVLIVQLLATLSRLWVDRHTPLILEVEFGLKPQQALQAQEG